MYIVLQRSCAMWLGRFETILSGIWRRVRLVKWPMSRRQRTAEFIRFGCDLLDRLFSIERAIDMMPNGAIQSGRAILCIAVLNEPVKLTKPI